jgi:formylglycine-generating enzyme required for sulfatase activity
LTSHLFRLYPQESIQKTLDQMIEDQRTLHLSVALAMVDRPVNERAVWVIDQFEEVFTECQDEKEREQFFANLIYAASIPDGRNIVVLTLRADFFQKCAAYPNLSTQIAAQQFIVSPMDVEGLRRAIEEPARHVGLRFDEGLVESILDDVNNQPGSLPLLEHALLELWGRRRGQALTFKGYAESGGVQGAIAKRADTIFADFTAAQQVVARQIMLRLTQPGEGTEDTRRRATINELITRQEEKAVVEKVIRILTNERLLTTTDEQAYGEMVSVSHEALIRCWPRLRTWIEENRTGLRILHRLTEAAQEWQRLNRDTGVLYRGARLVEALEWREKSEAELNPLEREFIDASVAIKAREEEAEKELQRRELETAQRLAAEAQARAEAERREAEAATKLAEAAQAMARTERQGRLVARSLLVVSLVSLLLVVIFAYRPIQASLLRQQARDTSMVLIPSSDALFGDSQNSDAENLSFLPGTKQVIAPFQIEAYEVTNQRYLICVKAGYCSPPAAPTSSYSGPEKESLPVVNITGVQAGQFCEWLGRRLPTELEWERAARYTDGRQWPWGNEPPSTELANFYYGQEAGLRATGQYPGGKSPEGVYDLAGNVWEWTSSAFDYRDPQGSVGVVRGGSYNVSPDSVMQNTIAFRLEVSPYTTDDAIGFRCASD